jgi:hypothetical protein
MPNPPKKGVPPPASRRPAPRSASRRKRERRREEALRALTHPHRRSRRRWIWNGAGAAVVAGAVIVLVLLLRSPNSGGATTSTPTPTATTTPTTASLLLAPVGTAATGKAVDGIQCQPMEQIAYHIHAHVAVYVNGNARLIPEGAGIVAPRQEVSTSEGPYVIGGTCFYWLHTHTNDGIIHVEAPAQQAFTLGQFFDIWGQPLTATQVGPATGSLIVYVNGQRYTGDPRAITLTAHELIQLDVGTDFAPQPFSFPIGL